MSHVTDTWRQMRMRRVSGKVFEKYIFEEYRQMCMSHSTHDHVR